MTNLEMFKKVFGFTPCMPYTDYDKCQTGTLPCPAPEKVCDVMESLYDNWACENCPFDDWWHKEYKPCFSLREDLNE